MKFTNKNIHAFTKDLLSCISAIAIAALIMPSSANASDEGHPLEDHEKDYVYGAPANPTDLWIIANGMRLYDDWMSVLDKDEPGGTHPSWPSSNTNKKGAMTWRCKSCHGWDLKGVDGQYASGSYKTGIIGISGVANTDPNKIHSILMDKTHQYTHDMIPEVSMLRLSKAVSIGQYDTDKYINPDKTIKVGTLDRGREIFQNTCAACHGYDATALNWGTTAEPKYISTEANANPWEVMAKIRHGHTGVAMISLIAFPMTDIASILKYVKTLPQ